MKAFLTWKIMFDMESRCVTDHKLILILRLN